MNRYPLSVAISYDECASWAHHRILTNPGCQVSYPGVTQAGDGTILVVWQQWLAKTFHFPPYENIKTPAEVRRALPRRGCGKAHGCRPSEATAKTGPRGAGLTIPSVR